MTSAIHKPSTDAQATSDLNQLTGIVNKVETGKIAETQATQAFQTEYDAMRAHGDIQQVYAKLTDAVGASLSDGRKTMSAFPNLDVSLHSWPDQVVTFNPMGQANTPDAPIAALDIMNGTLSFSSANQIKAEAVSNAQSANTYAKPIIDSANAFAKGNESAQTTDAQISQEMKIANAAGYNLTDARSKEMIQDLARSDGLAVEINEHDSTVKFSHIGPNNDNQHVVVHTDSGTVEAQRQDNVDTVILTNDVTKGAEVGAIAGGISLNIVPTLILGGVGAAGGAIKGWMDIHDLSLENDGRKRFLEEWDGLDRKSYNQQNLDILE
jgi:hypothetical protein